MHADPFVPAARDLRDALDFWTADDGCNPAERVRLHRPARVRSHARIHRDAPLNVNATRDFHRLDVCDLLGS